VHVSDRRHFEGLLCVLDKRLLERSELESVLQLFLMLIFLVFGLNDSLASVLLDWRVGLGYTRSS